jgi:uncharacterized membrane protein YjjP (DUF1212 family)
MKEIKLIQELLQTLPNNYQVPATTLVIVIIAMTIITTSNNNNKDKTSTIVYVNGSGNTINLNK